MFRGLRLTAVALLVVPAALFTRRPRTGWQSDLVAARIKSQGATSDEVGDGRSDAPPLLPPKGSPLGEVKGPLPSAALPLANPGRPANAQRSLPVLGIEPGAQELPYEDALLTPAVTEVAGSPIRPAELCDTPEPAETLVSNSLTVGADGTIDVASGVVRFGQQTTEVNRHGDGLEIDLPVGWCWAARPVESEPLTIMVPAGPLSVPAGTTALALVEADRSTFLVVVSGEAVLLHAGGRLRLRAGAMVLALTDAEPQVGSASESEVLADSLVSSNLALDAQI